MGNIYILELTKYNIMHIYLVILGVYLFDYSNDIYLYAYIKQCEVLKRIHILTKYI